MKILIVDGSKERRRDLTFALADLDNVVVQGAVPDVRSALLALVGATPDVVLTDVTLPDGDGTYLIERVRKLARMPAIIVLATRSTDEQRAHYLALGADGYLDRQDVAGMRAAVLGLAATRHAVGSIPPQDTQRLLGRMTAGVVHDFNNYLHVADVSLDMAQRQGTTHEGIESARAALDAMQRLTATLLTYARGSVPTTTPLDLGVIVSDTLAIAARVIALNIVVDVDLRDGLRPVIGVRTELEQLLLNLIVNACEAMPDGGRLEVAVRACTSQAVMLEISDTGTGVADAASSTKGGRNGVGLGLTIVRSVIARHGGALRIVARPSGGTTVAVMLPTSAAASASSGANA